MDNETTPTGRLSRSQPEMQQVKKTVVLCTDTSIARRLAEKLMEEAPVVVTTYDGTEVTRSPAATMTGTIQLTDSGEKIMCSFKTTSATVQKLRPSHGHRVDPVRSRKRGRQLNSTEGFTHSKTPGPSRTAAKRLKAKAKGVATAKARSCYRSGKK